MTMSLRIILGLVRNILNFWNQVKKPVSQARYSSACRFAVRAWPHVPAAETARTGPRCVLTRLAGTGIMRVRHISLG